MQNERSARRAALSPEDSGLPRFYRVAQIAALLDVHRSTVYRAIESGALRAVRVGQGRGGLRVSGSALSAFLTTSTVREVTA